MLLTSVRGMSLTWTTVSGERGTTGVRESVVTANLINDGTLATDDYRLFWAQDPYDRAYQCVDRSVLRFMSDDERYDELFPQRPLVQGETPVSDTPQQCPLRFTYILKTTGKGNSETFIGNPIYAK
jgi:hypothetical protein